MHILFPFPTDLQDSKAVYLVPTCAHASWFLENICCPTPLLTWKTWNNTFDKTGALASSPLLQSQGTLLAPSTSHAVQQYTASTALRGPSGAAGQQNGLRNDCCLSFFTCMPFLFLGKR